MAKTSRRSALALIGAALSADLRAAKPEPRSGDELEEFQSGDPNGPREYVAFSPQKVASNVGETKADYLPLVSDFGSRLLQEATKFIGFNRKDNHNQIADMLELFGLAFADSKKMPYAFCAAGVGYVAAKIYAESKGQTATFTNIVQCLGEIDHYHFYPTPGVANMVTVATVHGRWVPKAAVVSSTKPVKPRPGWLVAFKWNATDHHIGILKSINGTKMTTIEFNTSPEHSGGSNSDGGCVAERHRNLDTTVMGFIDTNIRVRT